MQKKISNKSELDFIMANVIGKSQDVAVDIIKKYGYIHYIYDKDTEMKPCSVWNESRFNLYIKNEIVIRVAQG